MVEKLLLCFDFDETLTKRHTFSVSDLKSVDDMKLPEQSTALIRRALAEGHQVAITTHNHRAVVERGLELMGLSGEDIIIIDTEAASRYGFLEGKRPHIRKAKDELTAKGLIATDYTPLLIDDSEQNIKHLTYGQHGLQVWQYDPDADVQPPQAVIDAHLHALSQVLEPARVDEICREHAQFLEGRDLKTGLSSNLQKHGLPPTTSTDSPQKPSGSGGSGFLRI
jgi:hypothetical protein